MFGRKKNRKTLRVALPLWPDPAKPGEFEFEHLRSELGRAAR